MSRHSTQVWVKQLFATFPELPSKERLRGAKRWEERAREPCSESQKHLTQKEKMGRAWIKIASSAFLKRVDLAQWAEPAPAEGQI